jgi:hypothetical protein
MTPLLVIFACNSTNGCFAICIKLPTMVGTSKPLDEVTEGLVELNVEFMLELLVIAAIKIPKKN